jgi:hypothetical protein
LASRESPDRCDRPHSSASIGWRETDENPFVAAITASAETDRPTYRKEGPGLSGFALEDGVVYHTYSSYERGVDGISGMYPWLDRAPLGRNPPHRQHRATPRPGRPRSRLLVPGREQQFPTPYDTEGPVESTEANGSCRAIRRERHAPNRECYRDLGSRESP